MLQKLMVNVVVVGGEDGASADQAAEDRQDGFEDGKTERYDRNRDRNDCGRFLRPFDDVEPLPGENQNRRRSFRSATGRSS